MTDYPIDDQRHRRDDFDVELPGDPDLVDYGDDDDEEDESE